MTRVATKGPLKLGLYRTVDPLLGGCARTHWMAGDGFPLLSSCIYKDARFQPPFEELPTEAEYGARNGLSMELAG